MYIGVTFAFFQSRGTSPISILPLKISHNGEAIAEDTSLNIEELKLSIPGALFGFIFDMMKAQFSERMFPETTAVIRKEHQKMVSLDVKSRCHRIHSAMNDRYAGDTKQLASVMHASLRRH